MPNKIKYVTLGQRILDKLNEATGICNSFGDITNFKDCDVVYGPDGTQYNPKFICAVVEDAVNIINLINEGVIKDFLAALPFVYTFSIPTMATDGRHIFMNPGFIMQLLSMCDNSPIGVSFVIIHEVYHNLFQHQKREAADPARFTNHAKANQAQDYEINWVIEHSYPDRRTPQEAEEEGESVFDETGKRVQLFNGITETCGGLIDKKYRNMIWEDIYDDLPDHNQNDDNKQLLNDIEIDYSDDYKDGMRQGAEDALRVLRAQGLVESVQFSTGALHALIALNESQRVVIQGTYDEGYKEGYDRVMKTILGLLNSNGSNSGNNGGGTPPPKEVKIPGMPQIKPKFPVNTPPSKNGSSGPQNPPVVLPNNNQQSSGQGDDSGSDSSSGGQGGQPGNQQGNQQQNQQGNQNNQGNQQQNQQGGGQGSQQGNQQGNQQGGGQGSQQGNQQGGGQGSQQNQQGNQQGGGQGSQQGNQQGGGQGNGQDDQQGNQQGGGQGSQQGNQQGSGQGGQMSIQDAQKAMNNIQSSGQDKVDGKLKVIGITKGGYSGKGSAVGQHVISEDEGRRLAKEAGHNDGSDSNVFTGRKNPFNDKDAIKTALGNLKKSSTILGCDGTPGCGMFDKLNDLIVSLYSPTINWKQMLKKFLKGFMSQLTDIGYNKKGIAYGRYNRIKDYEGETAKRILVCVDTSGSVVGSGDYLRHIVANVAEIVCKLGIKHINLIQFSDGVYSDIDYSSRNIPPAREFNIYASHTGGTSFMPVFNYIKTNYIAKRKSFQSVIFFTDDDVYCCKLPNIADLTYASKIIWFVLSEKDGKPLPYGKLLAIAPDEFKKQLTFATSESFINTTNEIVPRTCMNKRIYAINEGPFSKYRPKAPAAVQDIEDPSQPATPASTPAAAPARKKFDDMAKRKFARDALRASGAMSSGALAAVRDELYKTIKPWFDRYFTYLPFYKSPNNVPVLRSCNSYAVFTEFNTIEIVGDFKVLGSTIIESWPQELIIEKVDGNFDIGMCSSVTELPKGLPMYVSGDVRITNMRRIQDLNGCPLRVEGNVIVTACPNLKSLFGVTRKCKYFYCDMFDESDYENYLSSANVSESYISKRKRLYLNEAFKSNKLSQLAKLPANVNALAALKDIKVMWSEIPDEIIKPIYHNVARSIDKRRDDNKSGEYGIYIWCDDNNKINIIGTGNNVGDEWGDGKSWLYLDQNVITILNNRIRSVVKACRGDEEEQQKLETIGIKYMNKNISATAKKGAITKKSLTYIHLLFLPDLCARAYLIQGTKDSNSSITDNRLAHFSYKNSCKERDDLQTSRKNAIMGILMQGRALNSNDPMCRKYFNSFVTDETFIAKFANTKSVYECRTMISDMIDGLNNNAKKIRTMLFTAANNNEISEDVFDALYKKYTSCYIRTFRKAADNMLSVLSSIIDGKLFKDPNFDAQGYVSAIKCGLYGDDAYERTTYRNELYNQRSNLKIDDDRKRYCPSYSNIQLADDLIRKWFKTYITTISKFSSIAAILHHIKNGDMSDVDDLTSILY